MVGIGEFESMFEQFGAHARRWEMPVDPLGEIMVNQALGGAALQLAFRKPPESMAWTINIPKPPINVFVAGNTNGAVIGRVFTEGVKTTDSARLFVESLAPQRVPTQTFVHVTGLDMLVIYEQYFRQSVQIPARFFELSNHEMAIVHGLPGCDAEWVDSLTAQDVKPLFAEGGNLDEKEFNLHCGCTAERVAEALATFWRDKPDELFQGEQGVEGLCPRCGVRWWIDRPLFEQHREGPPTG